MSRDSASAAPCGRERTGRNKDAEGCLPSRSAWKARSLALAGARGVRSSPTNRATIVPRTSCPVSASSADTPRPGWAIGSDRASLSPRAAST